MCRDSILMQGVTIGEELCDRQGDYRGGYERSEIDVTIGIGGEVPNKEKPNIYNHGLVTIGENSVHSIGMYRSARILPSVA